MVTAALTGTITINGVTTSSITVGGGTLAADRIAVTSAINANSAATGVIATNTGADGTGITLAAADGRNIVHSLSTLTAAATGVGAAATTTGTVTLTSSGTSGITIGGTKAVIGTPSDATSTQTGTAVSALDISSVSGANTAITSIDAALTTVNSSRASLGAYQNRFASVVATLQETSENLSASRSRIQDADFAQETANLTRSQVLQQAGVAILAQANALPNQVLALLRG
jgi:flagellin